MGRRWDVGRRSVSNTRASRSCQIMSNLGGCVTFAYLGKSSARPLKITAAARACLRRIECLFWVVDPFRTLRDPHVGAA